MADKPDDMVNVHPHKTGTLIEVGVVIWWGGELADAFAHHNPTDDDVDAPLPPLMAVKLAAFRRAQAERTRGGRGEAARQRYAAF